MYTDKGERNKELISTILPTEASDILCIRPSKIGASDTHNWLLMVNGEYSTKTGYFSALKNLEPCETTIIIRQP